MLVTCPECRAKISKVADPCPKCGLTYAGAQSKETWESTEQAIRGEIGTGKERSVSSKGIGISIYPCECELRDSIRGQVTRVKLEKDHSGRYSTIIYWIRCSVCGKEVEVREDSIRRLAWRKTL